jgi:hypothetical protein
MRGTRRLIFFLLNGSLLLSPSNGDERRFNRLATGHRRTPPVLSYLYRVRKSEIGNGVATRASFRRLSRLQSE